MKTMRKSFLFLCVVIVVVVGLIIYATLRSKPVSVTGSEADFLKQAEARAAGVAKSEGEGTLPPPNETMLVPKIVLDPPGEMDAGIIPNDKKFQTQFKVYNRGKSNLKISRVATECACTIAKINPSEEIVRPGEFSTVHVTLDPDRIPGFDSKKTLSIFSDDPANQLVYMSVKAHVDPEFSLEPEVFDFGEFKKGTPIEKTIRMRYLTEPPPGTLSIKQPAEGEDAQATLTPCSQNEWKTPNRPEYLLTVRLTETIAPGDLKFWIYLENAIKRFTSFPVSCIGKATSFYSVKPTNRKVLLRSEATTAMSSSPHLTVEGQKPFEITDVQCTDAGVAFAITPGKEPNSKVITFSLTPEADKKTRVVPIRYTVKAADETATERGTVRIISGLPGKRNKGGSEDALEPGNEAVNENGEAAEENPEMIPEAAPVESAEKPQ